MYWKIKKDEDEYEGRKHVTAATTIVCRSFGDTTM